MALTHVVRHPQCVLNALRRMQGRDSNSPITSLGRRQLAQLVAFIDSLGTGERPKLVLFGTCLRHKQAGTFIAEHFDIPSRMEEGLAELDFGSWECMTKSECEALDPDLWQASLRLDDSFAFPDGTSVVEAREQVTSFLGQHDFSVGTLMLTSGFTLKTIHQVITGSNPEGYVGPCRLTTYRGEELKRLEILRVNEHGFLEEDLE